MKFYYTMPIKHSTLLNSDLNCTDDEISVGKKWLKWEEMTINWESIDLTWDEIFILLEVESLIRRGGGGGSGMKEYMDGNPWKQVNEKIGIEKTKSLIKVYCRVNNIDYEESRTTMEDIKVSINEFERFVKEVVSVKVNI
jgi:hypothetical protein